LPGVDDLYGIAAVLGISIHDLLPADPPAPPRRALARALEAQLPPTGVAQRIEWLLRRAETLSQPAAELTPSGADPFELAGSLLVDGAITSPPVDVVALARRCGALVTSADILEDAISGFLVEMPNGPLIVYNSEHPHGRQRFTVAHELGHLLLGHLEEFHIDISARDAPEDRPGHDPAQETQANLFAANLLMPAEWVREAVASGRPITEIAETGFEVSEIAFGYRLMALDLAPQPTAGTP
jgi:Zn-dependent peptidase ImmA (M78 family)